MKKTLHKALFTAALVILSANFLQAQKVSQTFRGTRIINGHSIETNTPGIMTFWISHRFGPLNDGIKGIFGLDGATIRLGLDYGVNDWLMVGVGRNQLRRTYDGFVKAKIASQKIDGFPISISWLSTIAIETLDPPGGKGQSFLVKIILYPSITHRKKVWRPIFTTTHAKFCPQEPRCYKNRPK